MKPTNEDLQKEISALKKKVAELEALNKISFFQSLIDNLSVVIWKAEINEHGEFVNTYISNVVDKLLGVPDGFIHNDWNIYFSFVKPEFITAVFQAFEEAKADSDTFHSREYMLTNKKGEDIWVLSKGKYQEKNGIKNYFGYTVDISESKKNAKKLLDSEARYKTLAETTNEAIFFSHNGYCIDMNDKAMEMFGYRYEDAIGMFATDIIVPEYRKTVALNIKKENGTPYEVKALKKNGEQFWVEIQGQYMDYQNKKIRVTAFRDLTHTKKAEYELRLSEQYYRTLIEHSNDMIWMLDPEGRFTFMNEQAQKVSGLNLKDWLGESFTPLLFPEDLENIMDVFQRNLKGEAVNYLLRLPQGSETLYISVNTSPVILDGKITGIASFGHNITNLRNTQLKLEEQVESFQELNKKYLIQNNELSAILNTIPEILFIVDRNHEYKKVFSDKENTLYVPENQIVGKKISDIFPPDLASVFDKAIDDAFAQEGVSVLEYELPIGGEIRYYEARMSAIDDNELLVQVRNISEEVIAKRKLTQQNIEYLSLNEEYLSQNDELKRAKDQAEKSDKLKTKFLHNMSHEIRTPMNGIMGFIQFLEMSDVEPEKQKFYISVIKNSGEQLLKVIDDILEISRLETKQMQAQNEPFSLNDLLSELFGVFDIKAKENKIPLYLRKSRSDEASKIISDKYKIHKILSNLLENALKFTSEGYIEIGYTIDKGELKIFIKDTGIGIEKEKQEIIFERFSQENIELSKKYGGLGLGLSIARENAALINGELSVESVVGKGSTFILTLPYIPASETENQEQKEPEFVVIVAEDEEVNYLYLEEVLMKYSNEIKILHAINGAEVVELCKNNPDADLVFMDIKMPGIDGIEATKQIREFNKHITIIAQTAYSTHRDKYKALNAGCDYFLSKPIMKTQLNQVFQTHLNKRNKN